MFLYYIELDIAACTYIRVQYVHTCVCMYEFMYILYITCTNVSVHVYAMHLLYLVYVHMILCIMHIIEMCMYMCVPHNAVHMVYNS